MEDGGGKIYTKITLPEGLIRVRVFLRCGQRDLGLRVLGGG